MRIAEYKPINTETVTRTVFVDDYNESGEIIGQHTETITEEKPIMGMVYRDMTAEEIAENERMAAEMPIPEEPPKQPEIKYLSREEFNLLDALTDNTIYYVTETNGTITMIRGENR